MRIKFLILSVMFCSLSFSVFGQNNSTVGNQSSIKKYLNNFVADHNKTAEKKGGIGIEFTGDFRQLPADLKKSLQTAFPNYNFVVAKMLKFHYAPRPVNLIVVAERSSGKITAYAWDLGFAGVSDSFRNILSLSAAKSKAEALSKVKSLSELLVFSGNGKVGKIENNKEVISAELFYEYAGEKEPYRILKVNVDKKFRFGQIALINPVDNKEGSKIE